jgi:flotillin
MTPLVVLVGVGILFLVLGILTFKRLVCICEPNEVLIFSGGQRREGDRVYGYKLVIGGRKLRIPLFERVDKMDLTNMIIDLYVEGAYSKGGIPLTVQGVANIKIAGEEPIINNAIERFLGYSRLQLIQVAKATLEGSLRGVLATLTPEEVNEDKLKFAERMVCDAEHDMTQLGLVIDNLKVQNVQDEVNYLDSIGRKQNANIIRSSRIAEARARADAIVRAAENRQREVEAQMRAAVDVARADAQKRLTEVTTRREALVAEERATVAAEVARAKAEVDVQKARIEQTRRALEADVIQPATAACEAAEAMAKAKAAPVIEDGRARADVLRTLTTSWKNAGPHARHVFLLQKLDTVVRIMTGLIGDTHVKALTMIDGRTPDLGAGASLPVKAISTLEQVKQLFGVDLVEKLRQQTPAQARPVTPPPAPSR